MEFRKNDLVTLEIEDCGIDGEGIGKADGFTVLLFWIIQRVFLLL